jgi:hypothetical protein
MSVGCMCALRSALTMLRRAPSPFSGGAVM